MTFAHLAWVRGLRLNDPIAKLVMLVLAEHAGESGEAQIRHATLAELAECSVDTVQRRLVLLERDGLIRREKRIRSDGGRAPSAIILTPTPAAGCGRGVDVVAGAQDGAQDVAPYRRLRHTPLPQAAAYPPAAGCGRGLDVVGQGQDEPQETEPPRARAETEPTNLGSNIPPYPQNSRAASTGQGYRAVEDGTPVAAFEAVWPPAGFEPPSKVARAWARLGEAERKAAIDGAAPFRAACRLANRKPGAASSYLSQRKWEVRAVTSKTAAQNGVYVILGTAAANAWLERKRAEKPSAYATGWPDWLVKRHPENGKPAVFMPSLFPPNAQGPPVAAE